MSYKPSKYQEEIYNFVLHGVGNAFISAKAGSGKTTTMVEAMKLVPEKDKCVFLAFNKTIVDELKTRVSEHKNCDVNTVHALGLSIIKAKYGEVSVDEYKYDVYLRTNLHELSHFIENKQNKKVYNTYYNNIRKLINISRLFLCQSEKEITKLAAERGVEILFDEANVVKKILDWGRGNLETVDYTDMVWLPNELLLKPAKKYDWVFCDEVQDFSIAYYKLVKKCIKRGGRIFSVGDEKQMINGFAGASEVALNELKNAPNTKIFQLPICYRCDKQIVNMAKKFVKEITPRENAEDGKIIYDCSTSLINSGDLVLCRTKAPLAKLYTTLLKRGIKCYINGSAFINELISLVENTETEQLNSDVFDKGVFYELYSKMFTILNMIIEKNKISKEDALLSTQVLNLYDSITTLKILSEDCTTKTELIERLKTIEEFSGTETLIQNNTTNDGICLSTIHKSKGMEYDNVFILCNPSLPITDEMADWEQEQEQNLEYVAITRAKHVLGFIGEKYVPKCGRQLSKNELLKDLYTIETLVNNINGITEPVNQYSEEIIKMKVTNTLSKEEKTINFNIKEVTPFKKKNSQLLETLKKYRKNEV